MPGINDQIHVLFGGTFNPVHEGHVGLVRGLAAQPDVKEVMVMPAGQNPFKTAQNLLPAALRLEMVRRTFAGWERVRVSDNELSRQGLSYTVDTLSRLVGEQPGEWRIAMGEDVFAQFSKWHRADEVMALAGVWVVVRQGPSGAARTVPRDPEQIRTFLPEQWAARAHEEGGRLVSDEGRELVRWLDLDLPAVSSSEIMNLRKLETVPKEARQLLEAYWSRGEVPLAHPVHTGGKSC